MSCITLFGSIQKVRGSLLSGWTALHIPAEVGQGCFHGDVVEVTRDCDKGTRGVVSGVKLWRCA